MSLSKPSHSRERTPGRGSGMAGVGLRSEQQFDKDNSERAKRNLGKDLGDMEVDAGADRPAKDKPVETTPQVTKKTKKDEEQKAAADSVAEGGSAPPNIPISTPSGRQEVPSSSSKTQSVPRPRRGRSRQRSNERRGSPLISASVAVEATEAARSAAPKEGWYTKQQQQLANQGQTVVTMDMLQKCFQVVQDSQGKIEQILDDNIKQTNKNTDRITALTRQAVYLLTEKRAAEDEQSGSKTIRHSRHPERSDTRRQYGFRHMHPAGDWADESISQELRCASSEQRHSRARDLENHLQRLHIQESHQRILQNHTKLEHGVLGDERPGLEGIPSLGKMDGRHSGQDSERQHQHDL